MAPKGNVAKASNAKPLEASRQSNAARKTSQICALCQKADDSLLQCGRCKAVHYCSARCQKADWREHKVNCRAPTADALTKYGICRSLQAADVDGLLRQGARSISFNISVMDGQVRIMKPKAPIQAFGVSTCAFVMVETQSSIIGWHASAWNMPGNPLAKQMTEVVQALSAVSNEGFVRGFVTPGSALTRDLHWQGRSMFAEFINKVMDQFQWWTDMVTTCPVPQYNDVIEFAAEHASPVVFSSLVSFSTELSSSSIIAGLPKHPPVVLQDEHGRLGLFSNASTSQGDIALESHALVFHEVPAGSHCEGCIQRNKSTKCVRCNARFCSRECCQRATALWHGAACGNAEFIRAERFCEGLLCINGVKLDQPWRAGMGGFKMLLSLVMAARTSVGSLRSLLMKYKQISSYATVVKGTDGGEHLVKASKERFIAMGGVGVLWTCWEQFPIGQEEEVQHLLREEASIDFDMFVDMVLKYNHQNQQGGLYYDVSFCAHSCRPNVAIKPLDLGGPLRLFALKALEPGEKLTMTFVNPQAERAQRRRQLHNQYGIDCQCSRCSTDSAIPQDELAMLMGGGPNADCCIM